MVKPIIQVEDVSFTYPGAEDKVLNNANLTVNEGEFVAIIGGNGSGKTTLCKTFNGLIPKFYVGDFEGKVTVGNRDTSQFSVAELSQDIGYVYQDFENQIMRPTVLDDASFVPLNYGLADYKERGRWALDVTGLTAIANEFIWELSGGQKHLLAIAGVLAMKPKILIVDEPVAQLDPQHAEEVYRVLKKLNEQFGMTIIVIEHHAELIVEYCQSVVLMDMGRILWKEPVKIALSKVDELVSHNIYPPQITQAARLMVGEGGMAPELPITLEEGIAHFNTFSKITNTSRANKSEIHLKQDKKAIVNMEHVSLQFRNLKKQKKQVLNNINTTFFEGERIAIVGNNGAGKSSLIKLIAGIVKPHKGQVTVLNTSTTNATPERLGKYVSYVYQNPEEMFIEDSVKREIELFLKARKVKDYEVLVETILKDFALTDLKERDARLLSGGQKRRVSLAIGAAMQPSVILLDEPTANLDIATKKHVVHMLETLKEHVKTVIIATHDMQLVSEWATRIIVMHNGEIIADGNRQDIFHNQLVLQKAGLMMPQIVELSMKLGLPEPVYTVEDFCQQFTIIESEDKAYEYI
ncbi:ATP-binding cassette domain-containing protein [Lysinibacillus sp. CD3-6]|uniref:ABC transporter ATP-binding protein n=1 Tax=Lysinibacillus sp. CD3-6 TaxID=2892541 RepID=UPI0011666026|nr:energy-coupling factor transporter ATPase [Lysinibacillus sp. CD3-6]UED81878.1 ATP-binding cassette domain-containing protein [Lysinibacillus sp. CD3-6]